MGAWRLWKVASVSSLVKQRVAVLAAVGGDVSAAAAEQATSTIPIKAYHR